MLKILTSGKRATFEILVSKGPPLKKGLSQAPCPWANSMPLSQNLSTTAAAQHCSWAILEINGRRFAQNLIKNSNCTLCSMRRELDKKHVKKCLLFILYTVDQLTFSVSADCLCCNILQICLQQ